MSEGFTLRIAAYGRLALRDMQFLFTKSGLRWKCEIYDQVDLLGSTTGKYEGELRKQGHGSPTYKGEARTAYMALRKAMKGWDNKPDKEKVIEKFKGSMVG